MRLARRKLVTPAIRSQTESYPAGRTRAAQDVCLDDGPVGQAWDRRMWFDPHFQLYTRPRFVPRPTGRQYG